MNTDLKIYAKTIEAEAQEQVYRMAKSTAYDGYEWEINNCSTLRDGEYGYGDTWIECANEAILRGVELAKE